eukprot:Opistho-2@13877
MYTVLHELLSEIITKSGFTPDNETALHEAFMLSRAQVYVGGDAYMMVIDKHFAKPRPLPLVVVGEAGMGKSALLSNWIMRTFRSEIAPENECLVYHFMGSSEPSTRPGNVLRRLLIGVAVALGANGIQLPLDINELRDKVCELLAVAATRKMRVTFVLDGLDQLEDRDGASELRWLPDGSAWEGHRVIISVAAQGNSSVRRGSSIGANGMLNSSFNPVTGSLTPLHRRSSVALIKRLSESSEDVHGSIERRVLDAIDRRDWTARLEVRPWNKDDLAVFIRSVLRRAGKSLSETRKSADKPSQMETLLVAKQCNNPLYVSLLLEELVAFGDFSQLDGYIERCLKCHDAVQLFEHVLTQLETEHKMEGTNIVEDVLVCLALARFGLSEMELIDILGIEQSAWSPIFYARRNFFVKRSGLLGFFHKQLVIAVERRYLVKDDSKRDVLLRRMVNYFSNKMRTQEGALVEGRVVDELPWLLKALEDTEGMKTCLTNLSMFQQMFDREKYELFSYWRFVGADGAEIASVYRESLKLAEKDTSGMLYGLVGRFIQEYGFRLHALEFFEKELEISESEKGDRHPDVANALNNLAGIHSSNGQHERALPLYERALGIYENIYSEDHPDIASTLNNLAALYDEAGQYEDALPLYERSLAIYEKRFGKEHPDVATALNNIAGVYNMQELYDKALPLYERALEIYETNYGLEHPDVALALNNMAGIYDGQGLLDEAIPLYKRSLDIYEAKFGRDHPDVATALMNIAGVYNDMEAYDKALPLYERSLAIRKGKFGDEHPNVATALNNLAELYKAQALYDKAQSLYEQSLAIRESKFGDSHPSVATALNNLALLYSARGHSRKALPLFERALHIREAQYGMDHPDVAMSLNNLASLFRSQNNSSKAMPLYRRSLAIYEARFGPDHPTVATALNNIAELYSGEGQHDKAIPLYQRAAAIYESKFDENHPDLASTLNNLATTYDEQGQFEKAVPLYERALKIYEIKFGPDHPDVAMTLNNLAMLHEDRGDIDLAIKLYERSLAIRERNFGQEHPDVAESLHNLSTVLGTKKEWGRVTKLLERAIAIRRLRFGADHELTQASTDLYVEACTHERQGAGTATMTVKTRPKPVEDGTIDAAAISASGEILPIDVSVLHNVPPES